MKRLGLVALLATAIPLGAQQPAQALGGPCNGMIDVNCQRCIDHNQTPPRSAPAWHCVARHPGYEWEGCTVYLNPDGITETCVVG